MSVETQVTASESSSAERAEFQDKLLGRRTQCGWEVPQDRLLSYEDFRRRVQAEGVDDLCGQCGTKPLPIL